MLFPQNILNINRINDIETSATGSWTQLKHYKPINKHFNIIFEVQKGMRITFLQWSLELEPASLFEDPQMKYQNLQSLSQKDTKIIK